MPGRNCLQQSQRGTQKRGPMRLKWDELLGVSRQRRAKRVVDATTHLARSKTSHLPSPWKWRWYQNGVVEPRKMGMAVGKEEEAMTAGIDDEKQVESHGSTLWQPSET